jgi:superfamily II DNA or RNA helicase
MRAVVNDGGMMPPADALRGVVAKLRAFSPLTRNRGQDYARDGRVGRLIFEDDAVRAKVHGTEVYDASWAWDVLETCSPSCTCPVAPYCKHAYALACCLLAAAEAEHGFSDERLAQFLPAGLVRTAAAVVPIAAGVTPAERRRETVRGGPSTALARLRSAPLGWQREHALERLLAGGPARSLSGYLPPFPEILSEPDPDLMCWRLAQEIPARAAGWLPRELGPFRDRSDLATRHAERARVALVEELAAWARRKVAVTPRSLRLVFGLAERPGTGVAVSIEARVSSPQMSDEPRSMMQLVQLRTQAHRAPGLLPADQAAALDWLCDHNVGGRHDYYNGMTGVAPALLMRLLERVTNMPYVSWSADLSPEITARAGVQAGGPVRLGASLVQLLPMCVTRDDEVWVELRFLWPDGRERSLAEAIYLRDPGGWSPSGRVSLVLCEGCFWVLGEEPPESVLDLFAAAGGMPLPVEMRAHALGLLATSFPHLEASLAAHTRAHPVTPIVALDLRADDWMQLRVFARAHVPAEDVVFEYLPEGRWERCPVSVLPAGGDTAELAGFTPAAEADATATAEADAAATASASEPAAPFAEVPSADAAIWLDVPEPETVEPIVAWLERTEVARGTRKAPGGAEPPAGDRDVGWWMFASRRRMEHFAEVWETRPPGVAWYGSERARRLLAGSQRIAPRLRIESSGVDWFTVSAAWEAEGRTLSAADLAKLRAATTRFVKLDSGWVRREVTAEFDEMSTLLADIGLELGGEPQQVTMWQLTGANPVTLATLERLGTDPEAVAAVRTLRERVASFAGLPVIMPPPDFTGELRPYQQAGLDFLAHASSLGVGAVLADDMGLGKTVQALAWLAHLRRIVPDGGPSLVVCPASVVHNWAREAERFAPSLRVLLLTSGESRHAAWADIGSYDLVVTNYALLRRDVERWRAIELRAVILDEAQNIKNPNAAVTRAAASLRASHRLALTGTPLENRALDLWSIISFVNPGYLGTRAAFSERFDALEAPPHARPLLIAKLRPVLLRRTKLAVAPELPPRIEERFDCELTKGQRQLYLAELRRSRALVEALAATPGGVARNKITVLAALTRLRQICCHPALAGGDPGLGSGKFEALIEILEPLLAEGHKVLVFSQFVSLLKLLQPALAERGVRQHFLSGQTLKREQVVADFQNDPDPCVFLVSLKAGGTGLNLTAASYVVLFDPWWNPAVEAQAIDRSHRIGQDRTVIAYRLLTRGTIEEKIWELQQRKAALSRELLGEDGFARALDRDALAYLLDEG